MTHQPRRIAVAIPRYTESMVGGAESLLRGYAEQLSAAGCTVEILTTAAEELFALENTLPEGETTINGITVRRFPIAGFDVERWRSLHERVQQGEKLSYRDQERLFGEQTHSPELYAYLAAASAPYDAVIVGPYPFGFTLRVAAAAGDKAIWVPCLHDEPMARLDIIREGLESARGILFNSAAEERFARTELKVANPYAHVVGGGLPTDPQPGDGPAFRERHGLTGPLILYAGRAIPEKNVPQLLDFFRRYRAQAATKPTLALVGYQQGLDLDQPGVVALGTLSTSELHDAYAAADILCQPSRNESFSLVLMEAWQQGTPVLVHSRCTVTADHVAQSGGGWAFDEYPSFASALDEALGDAALRNERAQAGAAYVQQHYTWPTVTKRLLTAIDALTAPRSLYQELAQRGIRRSLEFTRERYHARLDEILDEAIATNERVDIAPVFSSLRQQSALGNPDYAVQSQVPVVGKMIEWARKQSTAHIKEPYLDVVIQQQTAFNATLVEQLQALFETNLQRQEHLERRLRQLERQLSTINSQILESASLKGDV